jgi:hypothetical protein
VLEKGRDRQRREIGPVDDDLLARRVLDRDRVERPGDRREQRVLQLRLVHSEPERDALAARKQVSEHP